MSELSESVVDAARSRLGSPFRHHFRPEDVCLGGDITRDECLMRGMDEHGYDCSGLVVASICDAKGVQTSEWPRSYRHLRQMSELASDDNPVVGDVLLFYAVSVDDRPQRTHLGIFADTHRVIHATGVSGFVDEGEVQGEFEKIRTVTLRSLLKLLAED